MLEPADARTPAPAAPSGAGACPACAEPLPKGAERCACGEVLRERAEVIPVTPGLRARVQGVLLEPARTFAAHEAGWGWFQPWLLVVLCGVALGLLRLARVDVGGAAERLIERKLEEMPPAQRKLMDKNPGAAEGLETAKRLGVFMARAGEVLGPPLSGLVELVMTSGLVFVTCVLMRGKGARPDLAQAVSVAAHVGLVDLVGIAAKAGGTLLGNPLAQTSPASLADPIAHPVVHVALSRIDPVLALWWSVLAIALAFACGVPRRFAGAACCVYWLVGSLLYVGLAAASAGLSGLGGGGG